MITPPFLQRLILLTLAGLLWSLASVFLTVQASPPKPLARIIVINTATRALSLYEGERLLQTYSVGVGRAEFPTPLGQFRVIRKILNPGWENPYMAADKLVIPPGRNNPLGTRWLGFLQDDKGEYGIHGTNNPASVGHYSSHGCIRMRIADAEALYDAVDVGTPVQILYNPLVIERDGILITLRAFPDTLKRGLPTAQQLEARILRQYPGAKINALLIRHALRHPGSQAQIIGFALNVP